MCFLKKFWKYILSCVSFTTFKFFNFQNFEKNIFENLDTGLIDTCA